jgi:hypothetical protein
MAEETDGAELRVERSVREACPGRAAAVLARLYASLTPAAAELWLAGQDPHLHARPIDVLRIDGPGPIFTALNALDEGAYE